MSSSLRALRHGNAARTRSVGNLASGEKQNLSSQDAGAFTMTARIDGNRRIEGSMAGNLQSLISFSQTQDILLSEMSTVLSRIGELATSASNPFLSDAERNAYELENVELVKQFETLNVESFNGQDYFFSSFSDEKKDFVAALKGGWLRAAEELIEDKYGIIGNGDEFDVIINEEDTGGHAAFVSSNSLGDVTKMVFDMPDFQAPFTNPPSDGTDFPPYWADRVIAHELVHAIQARNTYNGDKDGDGNLWSKLWFSEGIAEFIHGGDYRLEGAFSFGVTKQEIVDGHPDHLYAQYYVGARYLHHLIKTKGQSASVGGQTFDHNDGIKAIIGWQAAKFQAGAGAMSSGYSQGINAFLGHQGITSEDKFLKEFTNKGAAFISDHIKETNNDTGAIGGSDADGGSEISDQAAVPDTVSSPTGDPDQPLKHWKIVWEEDTGISITADSSGSTWRMESVEPLQYGSSSIYNLSSQAAAALVIARTQELLDSIASRRSTVAANISRFNSSIERLEARRQAANEDLGRIRGTDLSEESVTLAKASIQTNLGMTMLAQANLTPTNLLQLL